MQNAKTLKARQLQAVKLLALGNPASHVAEQLHISPVTISRWRRLPAFEERLSSLSASGLEEIAQKMNAATLVAIENLQHLLCDLSLPANTQIKVSLGVLNAMASINGALEKSLRHRAADFTADERWKNQGHTYDQRNEPCGASGENTITV